jgi:4-amino-4-deoxy-L-arabinose transferase-like glycosyltransferase
MLERLNNRVGHILLLCLVWAVVCIPNLGAPALWDVDEGNNSEAAYEMLESGSLIVPTFDYQMRVDKPALLYWLQMAAYRVCGVNEFAARLPSALAALGAILLTYELGRRIFDATTALLGGLILATAVLFCASAHFANPDALLDLFTLATLFVFWRAYGAGGHLPFAAAGAVSGLGMLAKGPVGLVLPGAVSVLYLAWQGELRRLLDRRLVWGVLTFVLVAAPWYTWVGVETKGQWLKGFFVRHNVERALSAMENHSGSFLYYGLVLLVGLAPWSVFFAHAMWNTAAESRRSSGARGQAAVRFLLSWVLVYFVFFTIVQTKLPNYILPVYPAVALLTARALERWRLGLTVPPRWLLPTSVACLALIGSGVTIGCLVASGAIPAGVPVHRQLPALRALAPIGAIPVVLAVTGWRLLITGSRQAFVACVSSGAIVFTATLAAAAPAAVDRYKAPRELCAALPKDQSNRDVRVGSYLYFQPSLVFYCQREVSVLADEKNVRELLDGPLPAYVFLPAEVWQNARARLSAREVARHHDLYDGYDVVLITNENAQPFCGSAVAQSSQP